MNTKRTIGQVVSVEELVIEHEDEERFEVVEDDSELRPSVEQTIQGKVDTNHPDGVGRGLTLVAEERLIARELEIKRTHSGREYKQTTRK